MAISEQDLLKRDVLKSHIDSVNQRKLDMGPPSPRGNDYTRPVDEHVARGYFDEANQITPLGEEFLTLHDNGLVDNFGMATELGQSYLMSNREAQDAPVSVYRFREESGLAEAERFAASKDGEQRGFSDMIYDFAIESIPSAVETGYNIAIAPVAETALSVPRKIAELATGVDYKLPRTMSPNDITNAVAENMTGSILASEDIAAGAIYAGTMAMDDPATFGANILDKLPYGLVVRKVAGDPVMDEMVRRKTDESFAAKQAFERSRSEIAELTGAQMMETVAPIFQWAKAREQLVAENGEEAVKSKEENDRLLGSIALDPENVLSLGAGIAIKGATTAVAKTNLWAARTSLKNAALQAERAAVQSEMSAIQAGLTRPARWISDAELKSKALVDVGDFQGATRYDEFIKRVNLKSEVPLQRISELSATEAKLGDEIAQLGSSPDIANAILASKEKATSFRNLTAGGFGLTGVVGDKIGSAMIKADDFLDAASKNMGIDSAVSALKSLPAAIGGYVMGGVPAGVTAALNVLARGKVVQSMGNFSKVLGSELMQERGSIGYWGRVAQNSTLTKAQRFLAHRADELTLGGSLMDVARPVVAGTVAAYPMNLAFEAVSNPDASGQEILTNAMGPALVFGGGSAGAGAVLQGRQAHLAQIRMADEYNFTRRMAEQSTEGSQAFSSLVPSAKRVVSTLAATYPNLNWDFSNKTESYYDPASNTINVNPESNNPLRPLISHEVLHYVTIRNQMEPVVHSALLGDSETPGLIRNTDGTLDPEFKSFKDVYDARIANANLPPRTIEQVAEEYFNEATVDELLSMVDTGEVSRIAGRTQLGRKVKALIDATIPKITILKDLFNHTGGVRGMDGKPVMGNGLLAEGIRDLPEAKAIMRKLIRDSAGQDPTRATSGDRSGTRIEIKRGDSVIDSFHSIFEVDASGNPIKDKNGDPVRLSRATDEARKSAGLIIGEAQRDKVSNGYLPKEGEMKQQANGSWQGRYIDKSLIDVLAGRGILNPKQIAILRNLSTATKGNQGLRFLLTNHPATIRNRKGKLNYATLEATLRESVPVGFSITKDGNILVHNMSVGQLDANITARAGSKRGMDLYSGNTESIKRDVSEMMELHQKNTATDEFYQNKYGSRWKEYQQFINTVFGLMTKEQQSINPMFQSDSISSQKGQVYRTYRLDRISKATRMDAATSMPFHYENIKMNFLPDGFTDAMPELPQTAANIIALAKELDPVGFETAVKDWKDHIKRSEADGIMYSDVLKGDKITLAAQSVLVKFADKDPRAMRMLDGYGEDQFSNYKPSTRYLPEAVDAEYMKAVESGDVEVQKRMVDEAAKAAGFNTNQGKGWWHGSKMKNLTIFDISTRGSASDFGALGTGFYFSPTKGVAEMYVGKSRSAYPTPTGSLVKAFLKMERSATATQAQVLMSRFKKDGDFTQETSDKTREQLLEQGYDSVVGDEFFEEVVVLNPNQIKSADPITRDDSGNVIPLSQRFKPTTSDIRYLPEAVDADYMKAVKSGDVEVQKRLVDETMKRAGYEFQHFREDGKDPRKTGYVIQFAKEGESEWMGTREWRVLNESLIPLPKWVFEVAQKWAKENLPHHPDLDLDRAASLVNHMAIVDDAGFWDDPNFVKTIRNDPRSKNIAGFISGDGAVVIHPKLANIKSADPITYDDSGNVIPLSQRFKPTTSDTRYLPEGNKKVKERQVIGDDMVIDKGDNDTLDVIQSVNAKTQMPSWKDDKPVPVSFGYDLASAPHISKFAGKVENPSTEFLDNLPYDLNRAEYGRVKSLIENGVVDHFANKMANETRVVLKDPAIAAGKGWYSRMRVKLLNALGETGRELFSQFLGATSAQTPVDENFLQTVDAHEGMKSGRYDRHRKGYLTAIKAEMNGTLNKEIVKTKSVESIQTILSKLKDALPLAKVKADKIAIYAEIKSLTDLIETPVDERTEAQRIKLYVVANDLLPRRSNGAKFNANSGAVLKVIAGVWLNNRESPKTPNFAGNLSGRTVQATIDIWAARYIRRMIYGGEGVPWRIQPKSEVGVSKEDFAFSQIVMERAARKLDMNPDDLQAILWFAEKDFWDKNKWTKNEGAKKSSFDDIFDIFFPEGKKPLSFAEGSVMIKNAREQEKAIAKKEKKDNLKAEANALGISVAALTRMKKQKN